MRSSALVVVLVVLSFHRADASPKTEAQRHIDRATSLFDAGKPADALDELKTAYVLDPRPELLYAIGQTYLSLGQCADANMFYQRFLATKPAADSAKAARDAMAACKNKAKPESDPEQIPAHVAAPPPPARPVRWYSDYIADGLVGAGAISGVLCLLEYHAASSDHDQAARTHDFQVFSGLIDSANHERTIAIVAGVTSVALIGGGVAEFYFRGRRSERRVQVNPSPVGATITWAGRF